MSECGHCKDCRWWGEEKFAYFAGSRPCNAEYLQDAKFFITGGDNNDGLYSCPDFGCVHFEPKKETPC